jgi:hypothetical protein
MPDLLSHAASAYLVKNVKPQSALFGKRYFGMVLFGVFLPDIVARGTMVLFPEWTLTAQFFHTPVACFLQTVLLSTLFIRKQRVRVFQALTLGWLLHQTFDLAQTNLGSGFYYVLWPLYDHPLRLGLFESSDWPWVALITVLMAIVSEFFLKKNARK